MFKPSLSNSEAWIPRFKCIERFKFLFLLQLQGLQGPCLCRRLSRILQGHSQNYSSPENPFNST